MKSSSRRTKHGLAIDELNVLSNSKELSPEVKRDIYQTD